MDKQYDSFVFYRAWWNAICNLPSDAVCEVMNIVCRYVFDGEQPSFDPMSSVSMAVQFIIKDIDGDKERYEDICRKRKEAINKRWGNANSNSNHTSEYNRIQVNTSDTDKDIGYRNRIEDKDIGIGENNKNDFLNSSSSSSHARENLARWVAESNLGEWAKQMFFRNGYQSEINLDVLLDEFYNGDFEVREDCAQSRRMETLKHFQNWLPKYIQQLKNNSNGNNRKNTQAAGNGIMSPEEFANSFNLGWQAGSE